MSSAQTKDLLRRLSLAAGPPGGEDEARAIVRDALAPVGPIRYDRLGSLVCEKRGISDTPRVLLASHLDEVAFLVQSIARDGTLALASLGGWWSHVLLGQRVDVLAEAGRRPGVIAAKPPHHLGEAERKQLVPVESMYVDLGASSRAEVEALGVRVGDPVVPASPFVDFAVPGVVSGKAFDNRAGVTLMCEALLALVGRSHPNTVVGLATVQEEVGSRGAATAMSLARPDVALVLECTPADDFPGQADPQARLGGGPQIRFSDPTALGNRRLVRLLEGLAREHGIPIQLAVRRTGGTDAGAIHRSADGVPTAVVGVPARYIHSHVALLQLDDQAAALALVLAAIERLDAACVAGLSLFEGTP